MELATISFGQRFEITPIQLVSAVASIANGGDLITPRLVTAVIDSETGERREIQPNIKSQTITEENARKIRDMMGSVVSEGTGKGAKVEGYTVGGKTGTSEDRSKYKQIYNFIYGAGSNRGSKTSNTCGIIQSYRRRRAPRRSVGNFSNTQ